MKSTSSILRKAIGCAALAFLMIPAASADTWDKKTKVTFREPVEFPGGTVLAPGNYVLKLLNSSSNRNIVQVYNEDQDHMYAMIMAIPARRVEPAEKTVITFYETPQDRPAFIRTWFYPGDTAGQEFPYPKGRVRYTATSAKPVEPTITVAAAVETPAEVVTERSLVAELTPAPAVIEPVEEAQVVQTPAEEPVLLAQATPQPVITQTQRADEVAGDATTPIDQLPQTASNAPYLALGSLVLLAGAFLTRMTRRVCS